MKKAWIVYNCVTVFILASLIILDYVVNIVIDGDGDAIDTTYTGLALYLSGFNVFVAIPIWIIVLLFNRSRIDKKTVGIGFGLFLLFLGMTAYPIITAIGYMAY